MTLLHLAKLPLNSEELMNFFSLLYFYGLKETLLI